MTALRDVAVSVRSKNAGPFSLTIDLFFGDTETFQRVVRAEAVTASLVADLLKLDPSQIRVFNFEPALAIKISFPRAVTAGSPGDRDALGGQQYAPLLDIVVD